jgi:hypothetical protein
LEREWKSWPAKDHQSNQNGFEARKGFELEPTKISGKNKKTGFRMIKLQVEASFDDLAKFASENPRIKNSQIEPCSCGRTCLGNLHHAPYLTSCRRRAETPKFRRGSPWPNASLSPR